MLDDELIVDDASSIPATTAEEMPTPSIVGYGARPVVPACSSRRFATSSS